MQVKKTAYLFPGAGLELNNFNAHFVERNWDHIKNYLTTLDTAIITKSFTFDSLASKLTEKESQLFTYALSCSMYGLFRAQNLEPIVFCGYSMGLYASLYAAGAIDFETGLEIISNAFDILSSSLANAHYGMGVIIGCLSKELRTIYESLQVDSLEFVNTNNDLCHVVAGEIHEIVQFISSAQSHGAINAKLLPVSIPYHHPGYLKESSAKFSNYLKTKQLSSIDVPVLSSINQKLIFKSDDLIELLAQNLCNPINWHKVMLKVQSMHPDLAVECGPGISITQNARFSCPELSILNVKNSYVQIGI